MMIMSTKNVNNLGIINTPSKLNILAIDSATAYLSIALAGIDSNQYNQAIANPQFGFGNTAYNTAYSYTDHILEKVDNQQATYLIPRLTELLKRNNLTISDIGLIVYNEGPGSFTGLRIGLGVAKGIAFGLNINLVPIPAFALHVSAIHDNVIMHKHNYNPTTTKIMVGLDARLGQLYYAGLQLNNYSYFDNPQVANPQDIPYHQDAILIGSGFELYQDKLSPTIKTKLQEIMPKYHNTANYPDASSLIDVAPFFLNNQVSSHEAELFYLRDKIALSSLEQQQLRDKDTN
jgi:tRNA threonylcarbamoyladenosine biosynthesis protein TsaB